jgi:hypothetical protein
MTLYAEIEIRPSELGNETQAPVAPLVEPAIPNERRFESMPSQVPEFGVGRYVQSPYFAPLTQ